MSTNEYLESVEARLKTATPGPWQFTGSMDERRGQVSAPNINVDICFYTPDEPISHKGHKVNNFKFIAHAPTDIARLLEMVRVAKDALERIVNWGTCQGTVGTEFQQIACQALDKIAKGK